MHVYPTILARVSTLPMTTQSFSFSKLTNDATNFVIGFQESRSISLAASGWPSTSKVSKTSQYTELHFRVKTKRANRAIWSWFQRLTRRRSWRTILTSTASFSWMGLCRALRTMVGSTMRRAWTRNVDGRSSRKIRAIGAINAKNYSLRPNPPTWSLRRSPISLTQSMLPLRESTVKP